MYLTEATAVDAATVLRSGDYVIYLVRLLSSPMV